MGGEYVTRKHCCSARPARTMRGGWWNTLGSDTLIGMGINDVSISRAKGKKITSMGNRRGPQ